ncbi:MAG: formate dehydrogenase accessory sulfurtransferase FdhD [Myxococcota bacterium]
MKGVTQRPVQRNGGEAGVDDVVIEEPLEIRVAGEPLAVTMRTPGDDARLAVGFLFAEGVVRAMEDVGAVAHCGRLGEEGFGNVIEVTPAPGAKLELARVAASRRGTLTTAACGVCGRKSIDDLLAHVGVLEDGPALSAQLITNAPARLREAQKNFARTGGLHAAAALDAQGAVLAAFEDVGRHNAVDKVVGELLYRGLLPLRRAAVLVVSGRASFEIIQKALAAGIPAVASVSAASSLAIDLAQRGNLTLATFVRDGGFNVYTGTARVLPG